MRRILMTALAAGCLATAAPAYAHGVMGQRAPDVQFKDWATDKGARLPGKRLSDLRGKVVLLAFFGCHDPVCVGDVTRLNAGFETQGPKGLVVIGVAAEDRKEAQGFRIRNAAFYPCVSDSNGKIAKAFGVDKMQSCVLISATGRVVWAGFPRDLATEPVEAACKEAITLLSGERHAALKPIWSRVDARDFGGALKALAKIDSDPAKALQTELVQFGDAWVALATKAGGAADYTAGIAMLKQCTGWFKGHAPGTAAKELAAKWKAETTIKAALKTESIIDQGKMMEMRFDYRSAMALYKKAAKGEGPAAERAAALRQHLEDYDCLAVNKSCDDCRALRAPCEAHSR
jgi:peroxiredoxin